jgi:hypothetical protein
MIELGEAFLPTVKWIVDMIIRTVLYILPRKARVRLFAAEFEQLLSSYRGGTLSEADAQALMTQRDVLLEYYRL